MFLVTFFVGLFLPLVFANRVNGKISKEENRYLANFPELFSDKGNQAKKGIREGFENWINDNAGGREQAIIVNKSLQFQLFGSYPDPRILIGDRSWMYIIYDRDWKAYLNSRFFSKGELRNYKTQLAEISEVLEAKSIEFMVILWPYKHDIYPEFIRGYVPYSGYQIPLLQLDSSIGDDPNFDFSTAYPDLMEGKQTRTVYAALKDRYHWNNTGAQIGYQVLMRRAANHLPGLLIFGDDDYQIRKIEHTTRYPWGMEVTESDLDYSLMQARQATQDSSFFERIKFKTRDPWKAYKYYINKNESLPSAIVIGDSFVNGYFIDDMAESFYELVFIDRFDQPMMPVLINEINPDIIICAGLGSESLDSFVKLQKILTK